MRRLFGRASTCEEMTPALRHIFRCGFCLERWVECLTHPAQRDLEYDQLFERLEAQLARRPRSRVQSLLDAM